jgi:predicted amidohydrolase
MTDKTTAPHFKAALVQLCSGRDVDKNITAASDLIRAAAAAGADYIQTPENTQIMELEKPRLMAQLQDENGNRAIEAFRTLARDLKRWLHIGSLAVKCADGRIANRSFLFAPDGKIAARYDKIHMFDVDLGNGESYRESATYQPGTQAVIATLPWAKLGMTICYDLRFPALHRALAQGGAQLIAVPAAFTRITGEAHWVTLLRARAIEAQCFVLAAAQGGKHENGRETFGHSVIIAPWGEILAEAGTEPGFVMAQIDLSRVDEARRKVPSLRHDRAFTVVQAQESVT